MSLSPHFDSPASQVLAAKRIRVTLHIPDLGITHAQDMREQRYVLDDKTQITSPVRPGQWLNALVEPSGRVVSAGF